MRILSSDARDPARPPLHAVGRRGAAWAALVFAVVLATRLPGIGTPPEWAFDETVFGPEASMLATGAVGTDASRPLPKLVRAGLVRLIGQPRVEGPVAAPEGFADGPVSRRGNVVRWWSGGALHRAVLRTDCRLDPLGRTNVDGPPTALAASSAGTFVGRPGALLRVHDDRVRTTALPGTPTSVAAIGETAFVVTDDGALLRVSPDGVRLLAHGAGDVAAVAADDAFWVSFPDRRALRVFDADGTSEGRVRLPVAPGRIAAPADPQRGIVPHAIAVLVSSGERTVLVDPSQRTVAASFEGGFTASAVSSGGLTWLAEGRRVDVVEPRGRGSVGTVALSREPDVLVGAGSETVLAASGDELWCLAADPQAAARLGSALFGAAAAAAVLLLGLRLFGSLVTALTASAFVALDGLMFVQSRLAMNDTYVTALVVASWFAVLSAGFQSRARGRPLRRPGAGAVLWLAAAGASAGLASASKWSGFSAAIGILAWLAVLAWLEEGRKAWTALWVPAGIALGAGVVAYAIPYLPFLLAGPHTVASVVGAHEAQIDYAVTPRADFQQSPWYVWPFGGGALRVYIGPDPARPELWMAGNPVVFLGGLAAMIALAVRGLWRRRPDLLVVPFAAALQLAPWVVLPRPGWLYHYLPVVPFAALGLAWWVTRTSGLPRGLRPVPALVALAAAAAAFLALLPLLDAWAVSAGYRDAVRDAFAWMFR